MTAATFQKGDRVEFKEFPAAAEGKIVELWRRGLQGRLGQRAHLPGQDHHRERERHSKEGARAHSARMKLGTSLRFLFPTSPATHERSEACGDSHAANPAYAAAFSPLPAAARLMGVTGDMPIGMVLLAPFYHPLLLAEQIRTLAAFADGPLIVTFVAEGDPPQFRALGMEERSRVSWIGSPLLS